MDHKFILKTFLNGIKFTFPCILWLILWIFAPLIAEVLFAIFMFCIITLFIGIMLTEIKDA